MFLFFFPVLRTRQRQNHLANTDQSEIEMPLRLGFLPRKKTPNGLQTADKRIRILRSCSIASKLKDLDDPYAIQAHKLQPKKRRTW